MRAARDAYSPSTFGLSHDEDSSAPADFGLGLSTHSAPPGFEPNLQV